MEEGTGILGSALWFLGVVGGPVLLAVAIVYALNRRRRASEPPAMGTRPGGPAPDHPGVEPATSARQATTEGVGRYVLGISLPLAVVAMLIVYLLFFL